MKKRILSIICAIVMMMPTVPVSAESSVLPTHDGSVAQEAAVPLMQEAEILLPQEADMPSETAAITESESDNDALFAAYVEREFYGDPDASLFSVTDPARDRLTEDEKAVYDALKPEIQKVAEQGGSTRFTVPIADLFPDMQTAWNSEALGTPIVADGSVTTESMQALFDQYGANVSMQHVTSALLADCPYELYWYDKTAGSRMMLDSGTLSVGYEIKDGAVDYKLTIENLAFVFTVAGEYQGGSNTVVSSDVTAVQKAKAKAAEIAARSYSSDYERLLGYAQAICELTDYNHPAADNTDTPYGNPWQLIWVFDGNPNTKIVCEGFSKAFQYLCDLAHMNGYFENGDNVTCYIVTGYLAASGGDVTGAGGHMWNIVTFEGKNYLVDVTNCDDGTGMNPTLFLAGSKGAVAGAPDAGEGFGASPDYSFPLGGGVYAHYWYDSDLADRWGADVLKLEQTGYERTLPDNMTVGFDGTAKFGETLTAVTHNAPAGAIWSYQWYIGDTAISGAIGAAYTIDDAGAVGQTIKVRVTAAGYSGAKESAPTTAVVKGDHAVLSAPTIKGVTGNTITVEIAAGQQYAISTENAAPEGESAWQTTGNFTGLTAETTYYVFTRIPESGTHHAIVSAGTSVTTMVASDHRHMICGDDACGGHPNAGGGTDTHTETTMFYSLNEYIENNSTTALSSEGNYYLDDDLTLDAPLAITANINLCLNGYILTLKDGVEDNTIKVSGGGSLTLSDCNSGKLTHYLAKSETNVWSLSDAVTEYTASGGIVTGRGALITDAGSSFTMYGGSFEANANTDYTVYVKDKASFTLYGGDVSRNNITGVRGGSYYSTDGEFIMYGGTISENRGQGVFNYIAFTMNGGTISGNSRQGVYHDRGTFTMNGGQISGNKDDGIYVAYGGSFAMNGGEILENKGDGIGATGHVIMNNGTISQNTGNGIDLSSVSVGGGGGTYYGSAEMHGGTISGNQYGIDGYERTCTIDGGNFFDNKESAVARCVRATISDDVTMGDLNLVYSGSMQHPVTVNGALTSKINIKFTGKYIVGAPTDANTTMIAAQASSGKLTEADLSHFTCDSDSITLSLSADGKIVAMPKHMHAVCGEPTCTHETVHNTLAFAALHSGDKMPNGFGYYYLTEDVTLTEPLKIRGYLCLNGHTIRQTGDCAVIESDGSLDVYDCQPDAPNDHVIADPTKDDGSSLKCYRRSDNGRPKSGVKTKYSFTMHGGTIAGNSNIADADGTGGDGGGVYSPSSVSIVRGHIIGNTASGNGGGIYSDSGVSVSNTTTVSNNTTGENGGGIYSASDVTITDATVSDNTAGGDGGGVISSNSTVTMNGGSVSGNTAGGDGGGVNGLSNAVYINAGSVVSNNTAIGTGGGIYTTYRAEIKGGIISGNTAERNGGGVYSQTTKIDGGTVSGNTADGDGGGMYSTSSTYLYDGAITGNTAKGKGGGVYKTGSYNVYLKGTTKIAENNGGNLYLTGGSKVSISDKLTKDTTPCIGIGMEKPGKFTSRWHSYMSGEDPAEYFFSDDEMYTVSQTEESNIEAALAGKEIYPNVTIDYAGETLHADQTIQYSSDGTTWTDCSEPMPLAGLGWDGTAKSVQVRIKGLTAAKSVDIAARPDAPTGVESAQAGKISGLTTAMEYRKATDEHWTACTGDTLDGLTAGTYQVRYKATGSAFASANAEVTVSVDAPAITAADQTVTYDGSVIDLAATGLFTIPDNAGEATYTVRTASEDGAASGSGVVLGTRLTVFQAGKFEVTVHTAANDTYAEGTAQAVLTVNKAAAPAQPAGITATAETFAGASDGQLAGITIEMEYKKADAEEWTPGTGETVMGLAAGEYHVRVKETGTACAGEICAVIVGAGQEHTYILTVTAPVFDAVTYGYAQPAAKPVTITNGGNSDIAVSSVTVDEASFIVAGSGAAVTVGSSIDTWTVQPKAGLAAGVYTAVITVTYHEGETATANVSFTVNKAGATTPDVPDKPSGSSSGRRPSKQQGTAVKPVTAEPSDNSTAKPSESYTFSDVQKQDWFYDSVSFVCRRGLMNGTADGTFSPDMRLSRGMLVTILWRMENEPASNRGVAFSDVSAGKYYADAIAWAAENGVVKGYSDQIFAPEESVSREQICAVLYRYARFKGMDIGENADLSVYKDAGLISAYAASAFRWACGEGVMKGNENRELNPANGASRAETAAMLQRYIERFAEAE